MLDEVRSETPLEGMSRADFLKVAGVTGLLVTASGTVLSVVGGVAKAQPAAFDSGPLFEESFIYYPTYFTKRNREEEVRTRTDKECIRPPDDRDEDRRYCKPAAGSNGLLPDGRFLYVNALEGTEDSKRFTLDSDKSVEDSSSRVIKINYNDHTESTFLKPFRATGAKKDDKPSELVPGETITLNRRGNNADLFCSSQCHLPGGSILFVGGTNWYQETAQPGPEGAVELEGNSGSRFFDWKKNKWFQTKGEMNFGRWYPALVPLEDGSPLVMGGVHKLEKPIFLPPQEEGEPPFFDSGGNVRFVEKLNLNTGKWQVQGGPVSPTNTARKSLPLQPRIHLLPNGFVVYNGSGQAFSPNGQDPLQASWNNVAFYDPDNETWIETGVPAGTGCTKPLNIGSKLSTFEVPLLMEKDGSDNYSVYEILCGGGTHGGGIATNPGSYFANNFSRISTFDVSTDPITVTHVDTGDMFSPGTQGPDDPEPGASLGRWFGDAALLPDGSVFVSSGADRDEVVFPGAEFPILEVEQFDPVSETWSVVGDLPKPRTYHNTNSLLPSGEVIVGGHAPIPFGYVSHDSDVIPESRNSDGRDPTFQIWSPPYVSDPNRPAINVNNFGAKDPLTANTGGNLVIPTSTDGNDVDDVVILKLPATTHINDLEQRGLILEVTAQSATSVTAEMPGTLAELGGPGYYLAFIRTDVSDGVGTPSEGVYVKVKQ